MNKSESKYFNTAMKFDRALLALLERKPLEYITIREVCQEAQVNRSTFYLHYENISDLLQETIDYVIGQFASYFSMDIQDVETRCTDCDLQELNFIDEKYLFPYLRYIRENRSVFKAVLSQPRTFRSDAMFHRLFDRVFNPILERFHYPTNDRHYVMMFYLHGLIAIVNQWIQEGCGKSIEELSAIIHCCIFGKEA